MPTVAKWKPACGWEAPAAAISTYVCIYTGLGSLGVVSELSARTMLQGAPVQCTACGSTLAVRLPAGWRVGGVHRAWFAASSWGQARLAVRLEARAAGLHAYRMGGFRSIHPTGHGFDASSWGQAPTSARGTHTACPSACASAARWRPPWPESFRRISLPSRGAMDCHRADRAPLRRVLGFYALGFRV